MAAQLFVFGSKTQVLCSDLGQVVTQLIFGRLQHPARLLGEEVAHGTSPQPGPTWPESPGSVNACLELESRLRQLHLLLIVHGASLGGSGSGIQWVASVASNPCGLPIHIERKPKG